MTTGNSREIFTIDFFEKARKLIRLRYRRS